MLPDDYDMVACIRRGIAFLDGSYPGWRETVDWEVLDMGSVETDVLANIPDLTGEAASVDAEWGIRHGILIPDILGEPGSKGTIGAYYAFYDWLTRWWSWLGRGGS